MPWVCDRCTFANPDAAARCEMCNAPRPAPAAAGGGGSLATLRERLAMEQAAGEDQVRQMAAMVAEQRKRVADAHRRVAELEDNRDDLIVDTEEAREAVKRTQQKKQRSSPPPPAPLQPGGQPRTRREEALAFKAAAVAAARKAAPVFVQRLCKHRYQEEEKREKARSGAGSSKGAATLKFWKKDSKKEKKVVRGVDEAPRLQHMRLDVPQGAVGPCDTDVSASFVITVACTDPQRTQQRSLDDVAEEGATTQLVFSLRQHTAAEELQPLITAAKDFFEQYFAQRARGEGAVPEVLTEVSGRRLVSTATLRVKRGKAGGMLGKLKRAVEGEFGSVTPPAAAAAGGERCSRDSPPPQHPLWGPYSEQEAAAAVRLLQHTQMHASVQFSRPFADLARDGRLDWDFFNNLTGFSEITFERGVYKSLQKVCDIFSPVAAAKMQLSGKWFRRMKFRAEPGLFRALREDRELASHLERAMDRFVGEPVDVDTSQRAKVEKGVENLRTLSRCVTGLDQFRVVTSHITIHTQLQGFDFFAASLRAAELKLKQLPPA